MTNFTRKRRDDRPWPALPPERPGCFRWRPLVEEVGPWLLDGHRRRVERLPVSDAIRTPRDRP